MQLPLMHRSTQMAVLKKRVRRKVRELRWRRHRARRRLELMRQIRWELLRLMQRLIDLRQRDAEQRRREQARRAVGGVLHMYKRWLGKWTRALKSHGQLIRQQEELQGGLNRRLRLLRRRLRKHQRPKQLVDSCFEKLAKAVKRWQRRPDYHQYIENQELIWAQEVEEVRRYLSDIRGKSLRRRKSSRRTGDNLQIDLPNFNNFWKSEVVRKEKKLGKIQASRQESPSEREIYRIPKPSFNTKIYPNLEVNQMRSSRRKPSRRHSKKDRSVPSLTELQKVLRLLMDQNPTVPGISTASAKNSKRKLSRMKAKTTLYQNLKNEINIKKPQSLHKKDGRNQVSFIMKRLRRINTGRRSKVLQSRMGSIKRAVKHLWPAMTTLRRRIPIRHKYVKKPKTKFVDKKFRKEVEVIKKTHKKGQGDSMESKNLRDKSDLSMSPSRKNARKTKSKFVDEKSRKELGINNEKTESKNQWNSSDLSNSSSHKIRKAIEDLNIKSKKGGRRKEAMENKNLWDTSDLPISPSQEYATKPKSKVVGKKIREEMGKNKMENKNLWDSSDLSISPSQEYATKPKSKVVGKKIRKEIGKNTKKSSRDSKESKNLRDSSDLPISPSHKNARKPRSKFVDEGVKKEMADKESLNVNRKSYRRWDSMEIEKLSDSSDLVGYSTRHTRLKKSNKEKRKISLTNQSSDDGTDIMVNKLMSRKQLYETSVSNLDFVRDSIATFSESLNQIIMDNRPLRRSTRKSIFGSGLLPAGNKSSNLNLKRTSNNGSLSGNYRPRKSIKIPVGAVASAPAVSGKRSVNAYTYRKGSMRSSRGTHGSVVQSKHPMNHRTKSIDPIVVHSNDSMEFKGNELILTRRNESSDKFVNNADYQLDDQNELILTRRNEGSDKFVNNADYQLDDHKEYNTVNTKGSFIGYKKDHDFGGPDTNNADPEVGYDLRFIRGDQTYDQNLNKTVSKANMFKAAGTIDQDKNKTTPKISFSVHHSQYKDLNNSNPRPVELRTSGRDKNKTSLIQDQEQSRIEKDSDLNYKKDEGHHDHITFPLVSSQFNIRNLQSDVKYRQVQFFLKDVIETNDILEHVPDVQRLMKTVGNHYMWDNLKDLYDELLGGGINKADVKRLLTEKYLNYLKTIQKAQDLSPKKVEQGTKKDSKADQLLNLRFWYRQRMSRRSFLLGTQSEPQDMAEVRSQRTTQNMDGTMNEKHNVQELNAERAKREKWEERLRRLFPTGETSASMSFASTNTMWEVEDEEEEDLRTIDERYSITNLKRMMKEHEVRFRAMEAERMKKKAGQEKFDSKAKLGEEQSESPTRQKQTPKKREKHLLRPINQLYYAPRKTSREQQIIKYYSEYSEDGQDKALEEESKCQDSCPECGDKVEQPCCVPSPNASSAILSSGSIEACAKNELLVNTISNVCTRCGYVHDQANPCSQPPEDQRKTLLLRMIKAVQAVRSIAQPTKCSEFCSCREILKRQEKYLTSCKSKLRQVESTVRRCPEADEGGGDR